MNEKKLTMPTQMGQISAASLMSRTQSKITCLEAWRLRFLFRNRACQKTRRACVWPQSELGALHYFPTVGSECWILQVVSLISDVMPLPRRSSCCMVWGTVAANCGPLTRCGARPPIFCRTTLQSLSFSGTCLVPDPVPGKCSVLSTDLSDK